MMTWRPSLGCAERVTRPASARALTVRVIDGGLTRSRSAISPGVIGPRFTRPASTEYCPSVMCSLLRSSRIRRTAWMSETRSSAAKAVGRHCDGVAAAADDADEGPEVGLLLISLAYVITASKYFTVVGPRRQVRSIQWRSQPTHSRVV